MRLFFIRHGETVDNVAGLYAGVRDSKLTTHGVNQTEKLGEYFAKNEIRLNHVLCSTLSRAIKTAEAIIKAQPISKETADRPTLNAVKVPELMEQDFGYYEGKTFYARTDARKTGKDGHYDKHKNEPGFVDIESKASLTKRADAFLDEHLLPLMENDTGDLMIAVVSHGILLSNLWKRLLLRLPRKSLTVAPEVTASQSPFVLEHLGSWSNTGYLELVLKRQIALGSGASSSTTTEAKSSSTMASVIEQTPADKPKETLASPSVPKGLNGWSTRIVAVNSTQHLNGLKRQRGGIGSQAHDEGQKKLDTFFKRQRKE